MTDRYAGMSPDLNSPYVGAADVTPNDSESIETTRAIYVGGAGAIKATMQDGSVATFTAVPVGTVLKIRATLIWATDTTATNIIALY
jgi:hypothetical protein